MNTLFNKKTYIAFFVCFFSVEAILSIWTLMQYDMDIWFNTGEWMQKGINIYMQSDHVGYPPLARAKWIISKVVVEAFM